MYNPALSLGIQGGVKQYPPFRSPQWRQACDVSGTHVLMMALYFDSPGEKYQSN